jgi:hypothetical protein
LPKENYHQKRQNPTGKSEQIPTKIATELVEIYEPYIKLAKERLECVDPEFHTFQKLEQSKAEYFKLVYEFHTFQKLEQTKAEYFKLEPYLRYKYLRFSRDWSR